MSSKLSKYPEVRLAYLFGSHAKGDAVKESDIDVAVLLEEQISDTLELKSRIIHTLERQFKSGNVDVTFLNAAGSVLRYQVVKNGELIYERDRGFHKNFQQRVWKEFFDFKPTLEFFYKRKVA